MERLCSCNMERPVHKPCGACLQMHFCPFKDLQGSHMVLLTNYRGSGANGDLQALEDVVSFGDNAALRGVRRKLFGGWRLVDTSSGVTPLCKSHCWRPAPKRHTEQRWTLTPCVSVVDSTKVHLAGSRCPADAIALICKAMTRKQPVGNIVTRQVQPADLRLTTICQAPILHTLCSVQLQAPQMR